MVSDDRKAELETESLPGLVRYQNLASHGLTRHEFDRLLQADEYERIAPGLFLRTDTTDDTTAAHMAIAAKRPEATLCLLSAASIHDLTDEIPPNNNIAIPRGTYEPATAPITVTWHHFDVPTFDVGRTRLTLPGDAAIGLYSAERTIVDLFRLRHDWGSDLAVEALKRWIRRGGSSPAALLAMARSFPKGYPALRNALEILQ